MPDIDGRLIVLFLWGGGTVLAYGRVLLVRSRAFQMHHDRRAMRDLVSGIGLFLTALCSGLSIAFVLLEPYGSSVRGFMIAVALGAFLGVGIVMGTERPEADR